MTSGASGRSRITSQTRSSSRDEHAAQKGLIAKECTKELYDYVETYGAPTRWEENEDGLQDLELDTSMVKEIVEDVMAGVEENVEINDSDFEWTADNALDTYAENEDYAEELYRNTRLHKAVLAELTKRLAAAQASLAAHGLEETTPATAADLVEHGH